MKPFFKIGVRDDDPRMGSLNFSRACDEEKMCVICQ